MLARPGGVDTATSQGPVHHSRPACSRAAGHRSLHRPRRGPRAELRAPAASAQAQPRPPVRKPGQPARAHYHVRPIKESEVRQVAELQAEVFSLGFGVAPIDSLLLSAFKGETLSILRSKLETRPANGFVCLVAEHPDGGGQLLGAVEVSLQSEQAELLALQEKGLNDVSYAYIASMAVPHAWRRRGVASALLASAERWAGRWHQNWVLLHVYQSNATARALYRSSGFAEIRFDSQWVQLAAQKPRVLMAKSAAASMARGTLTSISSSLMRIWQDSQ